MNRGKYSLIATSLVLSCGLFLTACQGGNHTSKKSSKPPTSYTHKDTKKTKKVQRYSESSKKDEKMHNHNSVEEKTNLQPSAKAPMTRANIKPERKVVHIINKSYGQPKQIVLPQYNFRHNNVPFKAQKNHSTISGVNPSAKSVNIAPMLTQRIDKLTAILPIEHVDEEKQVTISDNKQNIVSEVITPKIQEKKVINEASTTKETSSETAPTAAQEAEIAKWKKLLDAKFAEIFKLNPNVPENELREKIHFDIEHNYISYPHGNHQDIEAIDPSQPINMPEHHHEHHKEEIGDISSETKTIVGPVFSDTYERRELHKDKLLKRNPNLPIKDINNFWTLTYIVAKPNERLGYAQDYGILDLNNTHSKAITYFIRKDHAIQDFDLPLPTPIAKDGYFFKKWSRDLKNEPEIKGNAEVAAEFRAERHRNGPKVFLGSQDNVKDINLADYVFVQFAAYHGNNLKVADQTKPAFTYFIRDGLTWEEAINNGLTLPEASPKSGMEFIDWDERPYETTPKKKVSAKMLIAKFGKTDKVLGSYVPANVNKPLDPNDPNKLNPNNINTPYNPKNYTTVTFDAGDHAKLINDQGQKSQQLAYLVRNGTKWQDVNIPRVQPDENYKVGPWTQVINHLSDDVTSGVYNANVTQYTPASTSNKNSKI